MRSAIFARRLWQEPEWLALMGYRRSVTAARHRSQADREDFFFSEAGREDPKSEMLAAVDALFFTDQPPYRAQSARCRFPARYTWLQRQLGLAGDGDVLEQCADLRSWYATMHAEQASILFASAYLESPSSAFGHTFLRFHSPGRPELLTPTTNYAADSSRSTGRLAFVLRGLFGGFPGVADRLPFFRRIRIYGEDEGRDMWEYPLHLNAEQIELLLLHLWEIRDGVYDYFFLGENCSYRTLALIGAAVPEERLLDDFPREVVPIETIRALQERGLVGEPRYRPSAIRSLLWQTRDMSAAQLERIVEIARGERDAVDLDGMSQPDRARTLAAAFEYASILINRGDLELSRREQVIGRLIAERLRLSQPAADDPLPVPAPPHDAHPGRALAIGWAYRGGGHAAELSYSSFQHRMTDPLAGFERGSEVVVLSGRYRIGEDGRHGLEALDLLGVRSTVPSSRLLRQPAWALHLGAQRKHIDAHRPLVATLSYARGIAVDTPVGALAVMAGAALDAAPALRGRVALEANAIVNVIRQHERVAYEVFAEHGRYVAGDHSHRTVYGVHVGVPLRRDLALAVEVSRGGARRIDEQVRVELRHFF